MDLPSERTYEKPSSRSLEKSGSQTFAGRTFLKSMSHQTSANFRLLKAPDRSLHRKVEKDSKGCIPIKPVPVFALFIL